MSSDHELNNLIRDPELALIISNEQIIESLLNFLKTSPNHDAPQRWDHHAPAIAGNIMLELMKEAGTSHSVREALGSEQKQYIIDFLIDNKEILTPIVTNALEPIQIPPRSRHRSS